MMAGQNMRSRDCAGRRKLIQAGFTAGVGALLPPRLFAQNDVATMRPMEGDQLVHAGDAQHRPLRAADIPLNGQQVPAWALHPATSTVRSGTRLNGVILLRLDESTLAPETRARAAEGVVAYTAICPHNGCDVDDWIADRLVLSCSCHASEFDPRDAGKVLDGPAPRALPALPLKIVDGVLAVAKPFTTRVGFEPG
jgi:rieske iron-sulfur protein